MRPAPSGSPPPPHTVRFLIKLAVMISCKPFLYLCACHPLSGQAGTSFLKDFDENEWRRGNELACVWLALVTCCSDVAPVPTWVTTYVLAARVCSVLEGYLCNMQPELTTAAALTWPRMCLARSWKYLISLRWGQATRTTPSLTDEG